jgi:hypothetical protein
VPVYFLKAKQGYTVREIKKITIAYIVNCRYEIQQQKEIPVCYSGIYRPISNTGIIQENRGAEDCIERKKSGVGLF